MIDKIKNTASLKPFITNRCEEKRIFVSMAGDILPDNYLVIKVDSYYNSLNLSDTPPSVDCLIPLKCSDNSCVIYLVELKNIKSPRRFKLDNIYGKFKTTIEDFMGKRFKKIFYDERLSIKNLELYFVSKLYKSRRLEGTKMDSLLSRKPFEFRGKIYQISPELPNPLIKNC